MVVLVDLEEDGAGHPCSKSSDLGSDIGYPSYDPPKGLNHETARGEARPNPNLDSRFSAALSCYPVVLALASHLDLNTLHDLSICCRQFRANLLQFRSQLVKHTLHCVNEEQSQGAKLADRFRESQQAWFGANGRTVQAAAEGRITSGRVGRCARDMVGECRRCGVVICRNCTIKSPSTKALQGRYRRLCRVCMKAPLSEHTMHTQTMRYTFDDSRSATPTPPSSSASSTSDQSSNSFRHRAFERDPCTCPTMVYLCHSCGNAMRTSDTTYMRGWAWRTRYSTYLGGLGTGIGEGNEGVECGRGPTCIAAREIEKEIDCDAAELASLQAEIEKFGIESVSGGHVARHSDWGGTSYAMQEIEGVGGAMKKKMKKLVRVGAVVREYEDERDSGEFLGRERAGINRSWCAWCDRVAPGVKDAKTGEGQMQ